jgi:hypothetical protein
MEKTPTTTKERPILFKGEMVRAILSGNKTQTRRIAKAFNGFQDMDKLLARFPNQEGCPYGKPRELLWVRETWASAQHAIVAYRADGECGSWMHDGGGGQVWERHGGILGSGTPDRPEEWRGQMFGLPKFGGKWRPSIFMPRWASRILLEITAVRVERLNAISDADALAEGCSSDSMLSGDCLASVYARLWESINGPGSWGANPWVWVVEFRRVQP